MLYPKYCDCKENEQISDRVRWSSHSKEPFCQTHALNLEFINQLNRVVTETARGEVQKLEKRLFLS
jgi:hypothetical protein